MMDNSDSRSSRPPQPNKPPLIAFQLDLEKLRRIRREADAKVILRNLLRRSKPDP